MNACDNCGTDLGDHNPGAHHCDSCGDWTCETCGGINNLATGQSCPCWVTFDGMPLADIKGHLAALDLSVETT